MPDRPTAARSSARSAARPPTVEGRRLRGSSPTASSPRPRRLARGDRAGRAERRAPRELVATVDHAGIPIGRYPGTLELEDRADGFHWSVELPRAAATSARRSSAATCAPVVANGRRARRVERHVRHVHEIAELRDVSVVVNPAYGDEAPSPARADPLPRDPDAPAEEAPVPEGEPGRRPRASRTAPPPRLDC